MFNSIKRLFSRESSMSKDSASLSNLLFDERMKGLEDYFKRQSETNELFQPEYEAAQRINRIALKGELSKNDLLEITNIYNHTNVGVHFDGSGWFDLRIHIISMMRNLELEYVVLSNNNIEIVSSENSRI